MRVQGGVGGRALPVQDQVQDQRRLQWGQGEHFREVYTRMISQLGEKAIRCQTPSKIVFQGHGECVIVDSAVYRQGECFCREGWQVNLIVHQTYCL